MVNFFNRNGIDLVENVKAFYVFSVTFDYINKLINGVVASHCNVSIVNFILVENILN